MDIDFDRIITESLADEIPIRIAQLERTIDQRDVTGIVEDPDGELEFVLNDLIFIKVELSGNHHIRPHLQRFSFTSNKELPEPFYMLQGVFGIEPRRGADQLERFVDKRLAAISDDRDGMGVTGSGGIRIWRELKEGEQAGAAIASWAQAAPSDLVNAWNRGVAEANTRLEKAGRDCIEEKTNIHTLLFGPVESAAKAIGLQLISRKSGPSLTLDKKALNIKAKATRSRSVGFERAVFLHIAEKVKELASYIEAIPWLFALHEEELRSIVLTLLNAAFEVRGVAEGFRVSGRTDIVVSFEEKDCLVGECKRWQGPKCLTETVDQAFSYLKWQDQQAAVIFFSKNKSMARTIKNAKTKLSDVPGVVASTLNTIDERHFTAKFIHPSDRAKQLELHFIFVNIYTKKIPKRRSSKS